MQEIAAMVLSFLFSFHHFRLSVSFCCRGLSNAPGTHRAPVALSDWQQHLTPYQDVTDTTSSHAQEEGCQDQRHPTLVTARCPEPTREELQALPQRTPHHF